MRVLTRGQILKYLVWLILGIFLYLIGRLTNLFAEPWFFTFGLLYLIFLISFLLNRFLRFSSNDLMEKFLISFALGLSFYLLISFVAILLGIGLGLLSIIFFILSIVLFIGALIYDFKKPENNVREIFNWQQIFKLENIYFLLPLAIGFFILYLIALQGPNLNGDPYFHLAIINKALDSDVLSSKNLALTKTSTINPAYLYPAWHVFLAHISQITVQDIFTTWANILYPLTIISIFVWYYLAKVIFKDTAWSVLALSLMLIFTLYGGPGYLYTRLGVPDTLAQLIILPLSLAFSIKYLFLNNKKLFIPIICLALGLILVHGPHYFYLLLSILLLGILWAIIHFQDQNYKSVLKNTAFLLIIILIPLILAMIALEIKSRSVSTVMNSFLSAETNITIKTNFFQFSLARQYGYFLLPLVIVFLLKSKRYLYLLMTMVLAPLIYWTPLKDICSKLFSQVFTDRLMSNTNFYFFVLALFFGLIILIVDAGAQKLSAKWQKMIIFLSITIGLLLIFWERQTQAISDLMYTIFYAKTSFTFVDSHYLIWLFLGLLMAIGLILIQKYRHWPKDFTFNHHFLSFVLMAILAYILISPSIVNVQNLAQKPPQKRGEEYFLAGINGDQNGLNFIKFNIFSKSVILASGGASKTLAVLTNQYLAYNPGSAYEKKFAWVFDSQTADEAKGEIVLSPKWATDYIYLDNPSAQNSHFKAHPEFYQLVYKNKTTEIYKVVK